MAMETVALLASDDEGWGRLIYLLLFLVLPMLNKFGDKIRDWSASKEQAKSADKPKPSKKRKGVAGTLQPVAPVVLRGERVVPPAHGGAQSMPPLPAVRAPQMVDPADQRRPKSQARPASPVKARRVRSKDRGVKTSELPTRDARAQRIAAARQLAEATPVARLLREPSDPSARPAIHLGRLDAASLRSVVVLSEILRPPLALRDDWPEAS